MNPDLDALATRLYVTVDDLLIDHPGWAPERPAIGIAPQLSDAELILSSATLAPISARCSHMCRSDPRTTSGSATPQQRCNTSSR